MLSFVVPDFNSLYIGRGTESSGTGDYIFIL